MRFGAVGYLNARPLTEGLAPLVLDTPAGLARRYGKGELDVALLPVVAGHELGLARVGSLGIAADGPVESVLLFLRTPLEAVRTLALDPASRTSNVLARIVLREAHGARPEVREAPADAEVSIGDPALARSRGNEPRLDLSEAWRRHTGLPFVFAAWYGAPAAETALEEAYARGRRRIAAYAAEARVDLGPERLERYLETSIRYRIGAREEQGLARFLDAGRRLGLL